MNTPKISNSSQQSAGQILPLLAILLTALFSIGMTLSNAVLSTHRNFIKAEFEFQEKFKESIQTANQINILSENNRRIEKILSSLMELFQEGTGQALDLAGSTPLWEKKLPIPHPEGVYNAFDVAMLSSIKLLQLIDAENTELIRTLPGTVKAAMRELSPFQSICLIAKKDALHKIVSSSDLNCTLYSDKSILAAPHLRKISDLRILKERLGEKGGLTEFLLDDELTLIIQKAPYIPNTGKADPVRKKINLTHPKFCISHVEFSLRSSCPPVSSTRSHSSREVQTQISFDPRWSIRVEDAHE